MHALFYSLYAYLYEAIQKQIFIYYEQFQYQAVIVLQNKTPNLTKPTQKETDNLNLSQQAKKQNIEMSQHLQLHKQISSNSAIGQKEYIGKQKQKNQVKQLKLLPVNPCDNLSNIINSFVSHNKFKKQGQGIIPIFFRTGDKQLQRDAINYSRNGSKGFKNRKQIISFNRNASNKNQNMSKWQHIDDQKDAKTNQILQQNYNNVQFNETLKIINNNNNNNNNQDKDQKQKRQAKIIYQSPRPRPRPSHLHLHSRTRSNFGHKTSLADWRSLYQDQNQSSNTSMGFNTIYNVNLLQGDISHHNNLLLHPLGEHIKQRHRDRPRTQSLMINVQPLIHEKSASFSNTCTKKFVINHHSPNSMNNPSIHRKVGSKFNRKDKRNESSIQIMRQKQYMPLYEINTKQSHKKQQNFNNQSHPINQSTMPIYTNSQKKKNNYKFNRKVDGQMKTAVSFYESPMKKEIQIIGNLTSRVGIGFLNSRKSKQQINKGQSLGKGQHEAVAAISQSIKSRHKSKSYAIRQGCNLNLLPQTTPILPNSPPNGPNENE